VDKNKFVLVGIGAIVIIILLIVVVHNNGEKNFVKPAEPMSKAEAYRSVFK
jgi:uncharacterized integral membrane protein